MTTSAYSTNEFQLTSDYLRNLELHNRSFLRDKEESNASDESRSKQPTKKQKSNRLRGNHITICRFWKRGTCKYGSECVYIHPIEKLYENEKENELEKLKENVKDKLKDKVKDKVRDKEKTKKRQSKDSCNFFAQGRCKFGHKCRYEHIIPLEKINLFNREKEKEESNNTTILKEEEEDESLRLRKAWGYSDKSTFKLKDFHFKDSTMSELLYEHALQSSHRFKFTSKESQILSQNKFNSEESNIDHILLNEISNVEKTFKILGYNLTDEEVDPIAYDFKQKERNVLVEKEMNLWETEKEIILNFLPNETSSKDIQTCDLFNRENKEIYNKQINPWDPNATKILNILHNY